VKAVERWKGSNVLVIHRRRLRAIDLQFDAKLELSCPYDDIRQLHRCLGLSELLHKVSKATALQGGYFQDQMWSSYCKCSVEFALAVNL